MLVFLTLSKASGLNIVLSLSIFVPALGLKIASVISSTLFSGNSLIVLFARNVNLSELASANSVSLLKNAWLVSSSDKPLELLANS